jgi:Carboxypeptidase regulatory-like domain
MLGSAFIGLAGQTAVSQIEPSESPAFSKAFAQSASPNAPKAGTAQIRGTVLDKNQGIVPGASVTLSREGGSEDQVAIADSAGLFVFNDLPPGKYIFTVTASGLETFISAEINLKEGQQHEVPLIALPIAATSVDVNVRVTERELAEEQIKAETKQRVLGIIPNYYSSYIWNASPLVPKQKFELAIRSRTDPVAFLTTAVIAGVEQVNGRYPAYGDGPEGYAKRYGAAYATSTISRFLGSAVFPSIFHQDPRYFYKGSGSVPSRAWYAMTRSVVARGDNGRWQPGYSHVLGSLAAGAISNLYHPGSDRGASLTFENAGIGIGSAAVSNLVREFLLRKIVRGVPDFEQGDHREPTHK